jgi:hypothetical protein
LRFLQASLLLPLHRNGSFSARAIPIHFEEVSTVKKPGKRGSEAAVAAYSALMLAALKVFGAARGKAYAELPKWRRNARRPSCLDLVTLLRKEATQSPDIIAGLGIHHSPPQLVAAAAA